MGNIRTETEIVNPCINLQVLCNYLYIVDYFISQISNI